MQTSTQKKARTLAGISEYSGTWDEAALLHLLKRTLFGVKMSDIQHFKGKSLSQVVSDLLTVPSTLPDPPVNNYNNRNLTDPNVQPGDTWVNDFNPQLNGARRQSLKSWWAGLMIHQDRNILEKMTLFWHNHFSTEMSVVQWANYSYQHNQLIRQDALGNFKTLVKDITLDPAMLIYLNGDQNTKQAPDENYSRELQELFTLGKGEDSKYTEGDVIEAAKVLTGWTISRTTLKTVFMANRHETGDKQFSSFYNNTVIKGKSGSDGANELDELLDMIFDQNEVAKFICRKLYRWFIYYEIDEAAEENFIKPLADVFRNSGYDIKTVMAAMLKSEHFFDQVNRGCLIKSPIDYSVGMMRNFDVQFPDSSDYQGQYNMWQLIYYAAAIQQQDIGDPPSVAGWPAYYQIPMFHEIWINSDTLPNRNKISDFMVISGYTVRDNQIIINPLDYAKSMSNPSDPNDLIDDMLFHLHTIEVSDNQKLYMKSLLLSGQSQDYYWTDAWNNHISDPDDTSKATIVYTRLQLLVKYLMNLSEFQLS
jgi:uncharacterized protein (DUF1800 family)